MCGTRSYLWSDGVLYPHHRNGHQVVENAVFVFPVGLRVAGEVAVRHADGPQAAGRHGLDHLLHHLVLVPRAEHPRLAHLVQDVVAPAVRWGGIVTLLGFVTGISTVGDQSQNKTNMNNGESKRL